MARYGLTLVLLLQSLYPLSSAFSPSIEKRGVVVASTLPVNWTYTGCYANQTSSSSPTLSGATYQNLTAMTQESCILFCAPRGFNQSAVGNSSQCFCGNDKLTTSNVTSSDCSSSCSGNSTEACGGVSTLNVFTSNQTTPIPVTNNGTGLWALYGCYTEGVNGLALINSVNVPGGKQNLTVAQCISSCQTSGYVLAGVEASGQCYCGNQFSNKSAPASDGYNGCNLPCNGNVTEYCGGTGHLDVYGFNNTVPNPLVSTSSASTSATTSSQTSASTNSTISTTSSPTLPSSSSNSSSVVTSTSSTSSVSVHGAVQFVAGAASQNSSTSASSSSTASTASATPSWYAAGCWTDSVQARSLSQQQPGNAATMTQELCVSKCAAAGYTIAGVEYYAECYCDNQLRNGATLATDPTTCNTPCNGNTTEMCGGPNRLTLYQFGIAPSSTSSAANVSSTATVTTAKAVASQPPVWTYTGCYTDSAAARTLTHPMFLTNDEMTVELCQSRCSGAGYTIFGVEYAAECYCDNTLQNGGGPAPDGSVGCNMACKGNATEICGGGNRLSLYEFVVPTAANSSTSNSSTSSTSSTSSSVSTTATTTSQAAAATGWTFLGCYNDSTSDRTLSTPKFLNGDEMTIELCQSRCLSNGFILSGVEYAAECYCDNVMASYAALQTDGRCDMACQGSATEICGGPNGIDIYKYGAITNSSSSSSVVSTSSSSTSTTVSSTSSSTSTSASSTPSAPGWYLTGCYVDSTTARTLSYAAGVPGGPANMTNEACTATCKAAGYTIAGTEYSQECYCDNALRNGGGPAPNGNVGCNMACNGNSSEICGGSYRLSLYTYYSGVSSSTTTSSSVTSVSSGTTTSTVVSSSSSTTSSAATGLPSGWKYDGCYIDAPGARIMANQQNDNPQLTIESCVQTCLGLGYSVAGMEYSVQCFCDDFVRNGASLATADSQCNMACGGNAAENCGAGNRMSIYNIGNLTVYQPPAAQNTSLPGNWQYQGCITDNSAGNRTLPYQINLPENNTATNCLSLCSQYGYPAGGMEYGQQCFCGDASDVVNAGATSAPETDCNMACSGDPQHICGAGNRISYYTWGGTPLYTWNRPTGNAAGQYQFLIGGVVVPLVTSQTIKGKVTFLEKWGTGPPNSTGAYELDITELNNFTAAWRPMHVKTDVFCSASLVLPDKAGRQINVGGWSDTSTFGIRLYTPDGSPGVWGTNDWIENSNELQLQNGRWYPSAMIMTNGSILVVGGEAGSNGAPVPTLELLPKAGGTLYCDWLDRTDPYNLYPFLAVLPSGGIFVAYYNEARILDEGTLQTSRVLPNIPGSVNNFLAGRTYPFEGTSVLMPQHAPYGDALTVMICGGSAPDPQIALDNCVSIQPEVAGANWTIERMPSKRVISCMTALPDGTYLILNGAQEGEAGFGLATDPNHNAILYDPTQPINQRMSVMANSTIDRLYHSEAILLQDGRVLVSGSDPEDPRFVQEYRVEVFVPPYLMSNLPRPTFTITNTDWAYGQSVQITITSGALANPRISLIGAESSTHGNSMGQRTIFPAFSCSGNVCTIVAPPTAHICPPGWFQLWVLDGPTPSTSTYVRIGGDPGSLGNWPNYPDFMPLPGV